MWYHPSVPHHSSFHSPHCQFVSFPGVLLLTFFSDTEFCICHCINRTRIVKIFCLAAQLGSSNQLGPLVMMGWRRQLRPRAYKCSQVPKILLAARAPSDSVCLNYSFPVCLCRYSVVCFILLGWVGPQEFFLRCWQGIYLPWILRVSSRHRGHGWQASGEQFLWMWMGHLRYMMGEDLQKCPASCTHAVVMVSLHKIMKVALLFQLQPCSASTVNYDPAQASHR